MVINNKHRPPPPQKAEPSAALAQLAQALAAPSLEELGKYLVGLQTGTGEAQTRRLLYSLHWPDGVIGVPSGPLRSEDQALAEAALHASNGVAIDGGRGQEAVVLTAHSGGGAVVLLQSAKCPLAMPGWTPDMLRELLGARLHELIEVSVLQERVRQLERAEQLQRALFAITDMAASDLDPAEMLRGLHQIVGSLMYAENFYIALYESRSETVQFIYFADANDSALAVELHHSQPLQAMRHRLTWHVLTSGHALRGSLAEIEQQVSGPLQRFGTDSYSWLGVPMLANGEVRGMLAVQTYTEAIHFSASDQALLSFVGSHILTALERRHSRAELEALVDARTQELAAANSVLTREVFERERGETLQAALYRIAELSGQDIGLPQFCASLHAIVGELIQSQNFYIALLSEDGGTLNFPYFVDERPGAPVSRPMGNSITEYVIRQGRPLLVDREAIAELVAEGKCEVKGDVALSWLGVPLIGSEGVLGAVVVQSYREAITYAVTDQSLLAFVSYHIATSLERQRAAAALRASNLLLEQRVEQRTRELRKQIAAREAIQAQLEHQVLHDALTGLPNRGYLRDRLSRVLGRVRRHPEHRFALLYLDVDRFKIINDSLGHSAGDEVLKEVSRRFLGCVRESDVVARLGGDEFAILLEEFEDFDTPAMVAQRVIDAMAAPINLLDSTVQPSVSVGIAMGSVDTASGEELLGAADTAMYRAKSAGRNRFQHFEQGLDLATKAQLALELDLRQALAREEFEPFFQAIVDLASGQIVGFEALMRWRHPRRGLLSPADFLQVAEDSGMIEAIDWQVFRGACRALAGLCGDATFVTLNVSPRHFGSDDFAERLVALIEAEGLRAGRVHIELTEGTLLRNPERVRAALERLHARGVLTALDDFGTGYSSLSYLHQFPLQMLKIDRAFVTPLGEGGAGSGEAIVAAILAMARALDLEVVAEGIETEAQRQRLLEMGCRLGQGYLFARPAPVSNLQKAILASR
ncbi:EAL domain-containing protein [Aquimonas sp.]|uniref:bifunctional diguanylate cyclase/phosphodiesterase n=1 Tax=Aquimonas sp. TaxID=1872588 RepID=UPI0037C0FFC2